jgi:Putative peptidoglycan binding domain
VSFGIRRRSTVLPRGVAAGRIPWMWHCGVRDRCDDEQSSRLLVLMVPGCLGYLNVNPREKNSPPSVESATPDIWLPPLTTVVSPQPRWLLIQAPSTNPLPQAGALLTKELQRQLRRVGCYSGEIDGVWTQSTRRAMQTFTNRVNATLPVERPDHVLLAILQSQPDRICNKPCPLGENLAPDGRCAPGAIAGFSIKTAAVSKSPSLITNWTAIETAALEDDIPPPARKTLVVHSPKAPPQRSMVATTNRERPLQHSERNDARVSQRADRESSRRQSEFTRMVFKRFDSSLR